MNDVVLRPARTEDLAAVVTLLKAADLPVEGVHDFFPDGYAVAERGPGLVGAAGVERYGTNGLLRSAVVTAELRGAGVGAALTQDRLEWSRHHGLQTVFLLTTTATSFFERIGFTGVDRNNVPPEVAAAPEFASICPSTAVVMRLDLA